MGHKVINGVGTIIHLSLQHPNQDKEEGQPDDGYIEEGYFNTAGELTIGRKLYSDGKSEYVPESSAEFQWQDYLMTGEQKLKEAEKYDSILKVVIREEAQAVPEHIYQLHVELQLKHMLSQDQFATPENTDFSASDKKLKKDLEARLEEEGHLILSQFLDKFSIYKDLDNIIVPYQEDVMVDGKGIQLLYGQLKG